MFLFWEGEYNLFGEWELFLFRDFGKNCFHFGTQGELFLIWDFLGDCSYFGARNSSCFGTLAELFLFYDFGELLLFLGLSGNYFGTGIILVLGLELFLFCDFGRIILVLGLWGNHSCCETLEIYSSLGNSE